MKMTKIESARIIVGQKGRCPVTLKCKTCFTKNGVCGGVENRLALAEAYIKRHEQKTKKKDHILDTTKKVTRPNFRKYLRDRIEFFVRVDAKLREEIVDIASELEISKAYPSMDWDKTDVICFAKSRNTYKYLMWISKGDTKIEYNPETDTLVEKVEEPKQVGIDNSDVTLALTAQYEPIKDCPVNSEYPDPIRVDIPDIFYCPTPHGILRFKRSHIILKDTNNEDCLLKYRDEYSCYRTLEEAVIVAKKLWNGEGK